MEEYKLFTPRPVMDAKKKREVERVMRAVPKAEQPAIDIIHQFYQARDPY